MDIISQADAARRIGVSPQRITTLLRSGQLDAVPDLPHRPVRAQDVERLRLERLARATAKQETRRP